MSNKIFIKGERVYFRPYSSSDAKFVHKWFNDQEVTYFMFTGQKPMTMSQVEELMEKDTKSELNVIFVVCELESNDPIGVVGLYEQNFSARKAEMRIIIGNKDYWGKGFGTEITELITYYGFERLNLNRIYLGYTADNQGAKYAYEKAGYVNEGVLKQDIFRNNRYYDSVRMAILRDDYLENFYDKSKNKFSIK